MLMLNAVDRSLSGAMYTRGRILGETKGHIIPLNFFIDLFRLRSSLVASIDKIDFNTSPWFCSTLFVE